MSVLTVPAASPPPAETRRRFRYSSLVLTRGPRIGFLALLATAACSGPDLTVPEHISVAEGFTVEVAAGPPLVERPMIVDADEQGRLYVAESSGSNDPVDEQVKDPDHMILRIEDTDRDGVYDKRIVFAEKVMFPEGVLWHDGSVYVSAPPEILKLTDTDGDGSADEREVWYDGQTLTGCANDLHGPYLGLDGWIYWTKGAFAEQTHEITDGSTLVTKAAHVFRRRPEGGPIETVLTGGMDNPVEVAFSPNGERFLTSTFLEHPQLGRRDGLIHALYGGVYGKVHGVTDSHPMTGGFQQAMTHMGPAAPVGLAYYESDLFGAEYRGNLFATQFNMHKVSRHVLTPKGASFATEDSDLLVSTHPDFHPTDVMEDADGSLLVVDTGGWYKLCCPTSQLAKPDVPGAIYRIRRTGAPNVDDPRGLELDWESPAQHLGDPRPAVRKRALFEAAKRGDAALPGLDAAHPVAEQNAVWALTRIEGEAARAAVRTALDDALTRHAAIHSVSLHRDAKALPKLLEILANDSPAIQRAAAEALGRIGDASAVPALLAAVANTEDPALLHSLTYALIEIDDPASVRKGLKSPSPRVRRAALIALDQMQTSTIQPSDVIPLLSSNEPLLQETANWIAVQHSDWGGALAGRFRSLLNRSMSADEREALEAQLGAFASDAAIRNLLAKQAASGAPQARVSALNVMAKHAPKPAPEAWTAGLTAALSSSNAEVLRAAVAAARALDEDDAPALQPALAALGRTDAAPDDVRLAALAAVRQSLEPDLFDFARANLASEKPVADRANAARALAFAKLTADQQLALTDSLEQAGPMELPILLEAFSKGGGENLGAKLLEALSDAKARSSLRPDLLETALQRFPEATRTESQKLLAELDADRAAQRAQLDSLTASLSGGDVRRGQAVFNSEKAACSACHRIGYLGGRVGPDLTRIGEIREVRDLVEAVVFPSASFVRSYEPVVVQTDADIHNGVIVDENDDTMLLATGANTEERIARASIEEIRPGTVSVMPSGLQDELTQQELADLVAFLKNARRGPN